MAVGLLLILFGLGILFRTVRGDLPTALLRGLGQVDDGGGGGAPTEPSFPDGPVPDVKPGLIPTPVIPNPNA